MMKTVIMLSGEFDYGEIFFKEIPPEGFSERWDLGHEHVPFPFVTYLLFLVFFFMGAIVALNVLVGLIVEATSRNFVEKADLRMMSMRLHYILSAERGHLPQLGLNLSERILGENSDVIEIKKRRAYEVGSSFNLMSVESIQEKVLNLERKRKNRKQDFDKENSQLEVLTQDVKNLKQNIDRLDPRHQTTKKAGAIWKNYALGRQTQLKSFDIDDEIHKLKLNVKEMMSDVKNWGVSQKENPEIERLHLENMRLHEEIMRLRKDNKSLTETKNDLEQIIQQLRSETESSV